MPVIRRAKIQDIEDILRLLKQVANVHHLARPDLFVKDSTKYDKDALLEIINDDTRPVFVYCNEKESVLGYVFCEHKEFAGNGAMHPITTLYIDDLCVDETARSFGIGSKLYGFVLDYAKEHNYYNVTLNVWTGNERALKFYEREGMKVQKYTMETILK